jgi:DNA repair exonuclease SbcCD ATPase subunit
MAKNDPDYWRERADHLLKDNSTLRAEIERLKVALENEVERLIDERVRLRAERVRLRAENERLKETNLKQSLHMAEKVEAFTAENERLLKALETRTNYKEEIAALRAENEDLRRRLVASSEHDMKERHNLRAALGKLAEDCGWSPDQVIDIARAALDSTPRNTTPADDHSKE